MPMINPLLQQLMSRGMTVPMIPPAPSAAPSPPRGLAAIGRSFMGEDIPEEEARRARQRAMVQAGLKLLATATQGNFGQGLAEGLGEFSGSMDRDLGTFVEARRRRGLDELDRRRIEEGITSSREGRRRAGSEESRRETVFGQGQEARAGAGEAAEALVGEIRELAGPDSPEARRAEAMLAQGPEGLDDIERMHDVVLRRYRLPEDFSQETDLDLERRKRIYEEDPQAKFEREMERGRLSVYSSRAAGAGGSGRYLTPTALLSSVDREIKRQYDVLVAQHSIGGILDPNMKPEELWEQANLRGKAATFDKLRELGIGSDYAPRNQPGDVTGGVGSEEEDRQRAQEMVRQYGPKKALEMLISAGVPEGYARRLVEE